MTTTGSVKGRARPGCAGLSCLSGPSFNPVLGDFAAEGVTVHPERVGALGEAAVATAENAGDEALFEFSRGVLEPDALVDHFFNQFLEPVANHFLFRAGVFRALWRSW